MYPSIQCLPSGVEQADSSSSTSATTSGSSGGGGGGGRFSFRALSNRIRGVDNSYESRLAVVSTELLEAEENVKVAQKELQ